MSSTQSALRPLTSSASVNAISDPPSSSIVSNLSTPPIATTTAAVSLGASLSPSSLTPTPTATTPTPTSITPTSPIPTSTPPTSTPPTLTPTSTPTSTLPTSTPPTPTPPTSTPPALTPPALTPPASTPPASTPPASTPPTPTPPTPTPPTPTPPTSTTPASIFTPSSTTLPSSFFDTSSTNIPSPISITYIPGQTATTITTVITSLSSSTSNGQLTTVTEIYTTVIAKPTLSHNNDPSPANSTFFRNTGTVAGVFILVGLAIASIIIWIFLAIRRRRRTQRLEHDAAVAATLTAAGFHRTPLDDEDDDFAQESGHSRYDSSDPFLRPRRSLAMSSLPSAGLTSPAFPDVDNDPHIFHPYSDYINPAVINRPYRTRSSSNTMGENITGHTPQHSGSHEPLLASYNRSSPSPSPTGVPLSQKRLSNAANNPPASFDQPQQSNVAPEASPPSSTYSSEGAGDHRLDPNLRQRLQDDAHPFRDLRDDEDYSRPVLGVRNVPDGASSQVSLP